ncbi:MAG: general secretion pathway protein GspB, partial [Deferrisomatales bacterium]|nr:general secretion pathway protein GspB [Deferrisomatales bacterium]
GKPGPASPPAPVAVETAPALPAEVPLLEALPPAQRQLFDGFQLDAHVYADDPAQRFVLIHMRTQRVGDEVGTGGLVLEAITQDGAVLRSGTVRALIPRP